MQTMFLKQIEMSGFKTFAHKTTLEFSAGITAIVGPNGSGKSNVTDALRWVLGENNPRIIRQGKMDDVIFLGSSTRKPHSLAEVRALFDNSDRALPVDSAEVEIKRKIYREGESEFFINQAPCRMKDILTLFMGTGLGDGNISILSENEVELVLSPDPLERRAILEEVAGVNKFRFRKKDIERKLEQTRLNLTRLQDIISEVEQQLKELAKQLHRFKRYKRVESKFQEAQSQLLLCQAKAVLLEKQAVLSQMDRMSAKLQAARVSIEQNQQQRDNLRKNLRALDTKIENISQQRNEVYLKLQLLERDLQQIESDRLKQESEIQQLEQIGQTSALNLEVEGKSLAELETRQEELLGQQNQLKLALKHKEASWATAHLTQKEADLHQLLKDKGGFEAKLDEIERSGRSMEKELQTLNARKQNLSTEAEKLAAQKQQAEASIHKLKQELQSRFKALQALERKLQTAEQAAAESQQQTRSLRETVHKDQARLEALETLEKNLQGYHDGVRFLLSAKNSHPGLIGTVAQIITVPQKYEKALEAALSNHLQDLVVDTKSEAKRLIEILKQRQAGRATFLPLDLPRKSTSYPAELAAMPGAIDWALKLISFEKPFSAIMESLLNRVLVAQNLDSAMEIYERALTQGFKLPIIATLEGEILAPLGSVTGGRSQGSKSSFLSRSRETANLRQEWERKTKALQELEIRLQEDLKLLSALTTEMKTLRSGIDADSAELQRQEHHNHELQLRLQFLTSQLDELERQTRSLAHRSKTMEADNLKILTRKNLVEEHITAQRALLQTLLSEKQNFETASAELSNSLKTLELVIIGKREKIKAEQQKNHEAVRQCSRLRDNLKAENLKAGHITQELHQLKESYHTLGNLMLEAKSKREEQLKQEKSVEQSFFQLEQHKASLERESHDLELKEVEANHKLGDFDARLQLFNLDLREVDWENLAPVDEKHKTAEVNRLHDFLQNFGGVNLGAEDNYAKTLERFQFLSRQAQDLENAVASFKSAIGDMEKAWSKKFLESFTAVKEAFGIMFKDLFGGGSGIIALEQPDNVLESGVRLMVRPPGKKLQNLASLSSGERALAAIAFLLSILKVNPSPFVMIDELDAPLDDFNVEKVIKKFTEFSRQSQFILITHNRRTMECADRLYGVTMEEQGVSKVVSVSLVDPATMI